LEDILGEIMVVLNPIICENCGEELQLEDIFVGIDGDKLVRICGFCGSKTVLD
jgi:hypothetical protein